METKTVVESLLSTVENPKHVSSALELCRVISKERDYKSNYSPEIDAYLKSFKTPFVICGINSIISVYIIEPTPKNRTYPVIEIIGNSTSVMSVSKNILKNKILSFLALKDFIPDNGCKQIIWVPTSKDQVIVSSVEDSESKFLQTINGNHLKENEKSIEAIIFSEYSRNKWTTDVDISKPLTSNTMNTTASAILTQLLKEF